MIIRTGTEQDARTAARLHAEEITEGFLSTMGPRFLTLLYRRVVRWPRSFLLVAEHDGSLVGYAAATEDVGRLYRQFLLKDGLPAVAAVAPRLVRRWHSALETLRYPTAHQELPSAELLAVAVASAARGRGIGRALVAAANAELARRGVDDARVVVAAENGPAIALYRSSGFHPAASVRVHGNRRSEVLTWS